jgi:Natural resistance-associated macrophage protein
MLYSDATAYFIILATAVTLHIAGVTDIETAAQAAGALRPLAGEFAYILFALGILGVGLIGVPVLAGSAAYALSETMGWEWGLELKAKDARGFYAIIAISVRSGRPEHSMCPDQSDEGPVLERSYQWCCGCSPNGDYHPTRIAEIGHGTVHDQQTDYDPRLDSHHGYGRCSTQNDDTLN